MPLVKRKYSRAGCAECKRRKIKCDEVHPVCGNCTRVRTPCVFPAPNHRNKPRRFKSDRTPEAAVLGTAEEAQSSQPMGANLPNPPIDQTNISGQPIGQPNFPDASLAGAHVSNGVAHGFDSMGLADPWPWPIDAALLETVFDDASNLAHGIADFDQPSEGVLTDDVLGDAEWASLLALIGAPEPSKMDMAGENQVSNAELASSLCRQYNWGAPEQFYLGELAHGQFARYIFPFVLDTRRCPVMRVVLEYLAAFEYMARAAVALGASLAYNVLRDARHDRNQKKYTAECMRLLGAAFDNMETGLLRHIEGLIWTVLLLTLLFCDLLYPDLAQVPVSWVAHLHEARALLVKYEAAARTSHSSRPFTPPRGVVFARLLFFTYDWIGKMSPGARPAPAEVDRSDIFHSHSSPELVRCGVVVPRGGSDFNMLLCLTPEVVDAVYALFEAMGVQTREENNVDPSKSIGPSKSPSGAIQARTTPAQIRSIMAAVERAANQKIVPDIGPDYRVPHDSLAHPDYSGPGRIALPSGALAYFDGEYYSWCDVAQQLHVCFIHLKLLTTPGLLHVPRNHPMIQSLVREIIALMFFVQPKPADFRPETAVAHTRNYYLPKELFDLHVVMIQLPFRMCIDITDNEDDLEKLELLFRGLLLLGSGNSLLALKKIELALQREPSAPYTEHEYTECYPVY